MSLLTAEEVALASRVFFDRAIVVPYGDPGDSLVYGWCLKLDPSRRQNDPCFDPTALLHIGWSADIGAAIFVARTLARLGSPPSLMADSPQRFALPGTPAPFFFEVPVNTPSLKHVLASLLTKDPTLTSQLFIQANSPSLPRLVAHLTRPNEGESSAQRLEWTPHHAIALVFGSANTVMEHAKDVFANFLGALTALRSLQPFDYFTRSSDVSLRASVP